MKKTKKSKKAVILSGLLIVLILATAGITIAFLSHQSNQVVNTFEPSNVSCSVVEPEWEDGKTVKDNVTIKNTGNIDAYIRAAIVVTWQDNQGNIHSEYPTNTGNNPDYSIDIPNGNWLYKEGYYYFEEKVVAGNSTTKLINRCEALNPGPDGYTLHVEIIADAIQADGVSEGSPTGDYVGQHPVEKAWGVTLNPDGTISN